MVSLSELRNRIAERVFTTEIASSALLSSLTSPSTNKWGDEQATYSAGTSIDVVPYNYIGSTLSYQPFGDLQNGEADFVVKYDTTVSVRDRITWQGDTYHITEIDNGAFIGGGLVVRIIRVRKDA